MPKSNDADETLNSHEIRPESNSAGRTDSSRPELANRTDSYGSAQDRQSDLFERTHKKLNEHFDGDSSEEPLRDTTTGAEKEFRKNTGLSTIDAEFNRSRVIDAHDGFIDINAPVDITNPIPEDRGFRARWGQTSFADPADHYTRALQQRQEKGWGEARFSKGKSESWMDVALLATRQSYTVTSARGGEHNRGTMHGKTAVDVRTKDHSKKDGSELRNDQFLTDSRSLGVYVRDERTRPVDRFGRPQKVWGGSHFHLQFSEPRNKDQYWGYGTRTPGGD